MKNANLAAAGATAATVAPMAAAQSWPQGNGCSKQINGTAATVSALPANKSCGPEQTNKNSAGDGRALGDKCALDLEVLGRDIQKILQAEEAALCARQNQLIQQLCQLRDQLTNMRSSIVANVELKNASNEQAKQQQPGQAKPSSQQAKPVISQTNQSAKPANSAHQSQSKSTTVANNKQVAAIEMVVNAHPERIPYAVLALKNVWKQQCHIEVVTYTHSSLSQVSAEARAFEEQLAAATSDDINANLLHMKMVLIWKNCEHTELICTSSYRPIYSEINLLRYLSRMGPNEYRYESSPLCNEHDSVLDTCYQLLNCRNNKQRSELLRELSRQLQARLYFGGDQLSIADIGVYSTLKRLSDKIISNKDLTPALQEWRKRAQLVTLI